MPDRTNARNVFIYGNGKIIAGFYIWSELSSPSEATVYRWLSYFVVRPAWKIFPCTVERHSIAMFRFTPSVSGPALDRDSGTPIKPGQYCIMAPDGSEMGVSLSAVFSDPFLHAGTLPFPAEHNKLSFEDQVRKRDAKCVITGKLVEENNISDFTVVQIIPPSYHVYLFSQINPNLDEQPERDKAPIEYFTAQNGLLMENHLVDPFFNCEFGIDVDDGYRIVQFHKSDTLDLRLYRHLLVAPEIDPDLRPSDYFLRERFKLAVKASLPDGGEVDGFDPKWFQQELADFMDPEGPLVDDDDERWNNPVGQETRRVMLHQRLLGLQ